MREHTRVFFNNEVDIHVSLNKVLRNKFYFDQDNQQLKANDNLVEGDHIKKYVSDQGIFDCKKYTFAFMECLEAALNKVDISQGFKIGDKHHNFTMHYVSIALCIWYNHHCFRCEIWK